MVELKRPYRYRRYDVVPRTLELLDDDAVVVSFEAGAIATVRALRPTLRTVQHVALVPLRVAAARGCWAAGFEDRRAMPRAWNVRAGSGSRRRLHRNDPERMRELAGLGVTGIFTEPS